MGRGGVGGSWGAVALNSAPLPPPGRSRETEKKVGEVKGQKLKSQS